MLINKIFVLAISHAHFTHSTTIWVYFWGILIRREFWQFVCSICCETSRAPLIFHTVWHKVSPDMLFFHWRVRSLGNRICKKVPHLWKLLFFSFPILHTSENPCFSTHWWHDRWETIKSPTQPCADGSAETKITERQRAKFYHSSS